MRADATQDTMRIEPRRAGRIRSGRGFTLVELMVVMAIVALLIAIVVPHYSGRITKAEEAVLQQDLSVMRDALQKHYADAGRYPDTLEDLVTKRYLRSIPNDPVTPANSRWVVIPPADPQQGGVFDVRSASKAVGTNGKSYEQW